MKGGTGSIIEYHGPGIDNISCTGKCEISFLLVATKMKYLFKEWAQYAIWVLKLVPLHLYLLLIRECMIILWLLGGKMLQIWLTHLSTFFN